VPGVRVWRQVLGVERAVMEKVEFGQSEGDEPAVIVHAAGAAGPGPVRGVPVPLSWV